MNSLDTIGKRLKYLRMKNRVTQQDIANITGINRGNISNYENDVFKPSADTIISYAKFFHVTTDWILLGDNKEKKPVE